MTTPNEIPPILAKTLRASRARIRFILAVRGTLTTLAVLVAALLGVMAIDAMVTIYSSLVRWLLTGLAFAGVAAVAWRTLICPLHRKFTLAEVAALIEQRHPKLEERLSTAVELAGQPDEAAGSQELITAITKAAVADVGKVSPRREFTTRTVKPRFAAAAVILLALGALFAAFPSATARLVARALVPSAEVDNIYASSLRVAPGDKVVLAGSPLEVNLAVEGGFPSRAFVLTSLDGRGETAERMTRTTAEEAEGPAYYTFSYPAVNENFSYRVNCGSALTRAYRVTAVPMPTFSERAITVVHPDYTGRAPDTYTNSAAVVGVAGSDVMIRLRKSRPDVTGVVEFSGGRSIEGVDEGETLAFSFRLDASLGGMWRALARDSYGFSNVVEQAGVTVAKDSPPVVKLVRPEDRDLKLPRSGVLPLAISARDDFGIARRTIEICVGAGAWTDLCEMEGDEETLPIAALPLEKSAAFRVRVRVEDNLPADLSGPGVSRSDEVFVELALSKKNDHDRQGVDSLARQELKEDVDAARQVVADIRLHLERAKNSAWQVKGIDQKDWRRDNAVRSLDATKRAIGLAEVGLSELVETLRETRLLTGVEIFDPVLQKHVVPARMLIEDIYLLSSRKEQAKVGEQAAKDIGLALSAFDEARRRLELLMKVAEDLQDLRDLAERAEALAESAENETMSAQEIAEAELLKDAEKELNDGLKRKFDKEKQRVDQIDKRAGELAQRQEEIKGMSGEEQQKAEHRLADDLQRLANETGNLKAQIESKSGTPEMDDNATSQPVREAQRDGQTAARKAKEATQSLKDGKTADAHDAMNAVQEALRQAREDLAGAKAKMDAKNREFAQNAQALKEQMKAVQKAVKAAQDAAQAEQQNQQTPQEHQDPQQTQDQQNQQSQPSAEQQVQQRAQAMRQAAQSLRQMANSQAQQMNQPQQDQNAEGEDEKESDPNAKPSPNGLKKPQKLRKDKRGKGEIEDPLQADSGESWFRLKGESSGDAERDEFGDVPTEYRDLVRDYFKALQEGAR